MSSASISMPALRIVAAAPAPRTLSAEDRAWQTSGRIAMVTFAAVFAFAVVRYVVFGAVAATDLPLFVANKAVAFTSTVLLAMCLALRPVADVVPRLRRLGALRKPLGLTAFALGAVHGVVSLALLGPVYYGKLYLANGHLRPVAGLSLAAGVIALALLVPAALTSVAGIRREMKPDAWRRVQRLGVAALYLNAIHIATLGWKTWISTKTWPAALPPITLSAIIVVAAAIAVRQAVRRAT